ncbi:MAG: condensation domain-containing protein, partial [Peristeroidobacter soli]
MKRSLSERKNRLSGAKQLLLGRILRGEAPPTQPVRSVARPEAIPLSYGQQRLWFVDKLKGPSAEYNVSVALRLHGALDTGALSRALDAIVLRHEIL